MRLLFTLTFALALGACAAPKPPTPKWQPPAAFNTAPVDFGSTPESAYLQANTIVRAYAADARRCEVAIRIGGHFNDTDRDACYRAVEASVAGSRGDQAIKRVVALGKQPLSPELDKKVIDLLSVTIKLVEQSRLATEYFATRARP